MAQGNRYAKQHNTLRRGGVETASLRTLAKSEQLQPLKGIQALEKRVRFICSKLKNHGKRLRYGSFSFVILHRILRSFGIIIKPLESLVRAFQSQSQLNHTNHWGAAEGHPPHGYYLLLVLALKGSFKAHKSIYNNPKLTHTSHGGAAEGRPPSLLSFYWLWLLKTLKRLLKSCKRA